MLARFSAAFSLATRKASMSTGTSADTWRGGASAFALRSSISASLQTLTSLSSRFSKHFKMPCFAARSTCSAVAAVAAVGTSIAAAAAAKDCRRVAA